jgi:nicotinamide-nucleotide amidase
MPAAIIASGDEIITGQVVDENSAYLSTRLLEIGIPTVLHLAVGDDLERIVDALSLAGQRADHVIVTGGLGPTEDDLSREAFCRFAGVRDLEHQPSADKLRALFAAMGRTMTPNNLKQARIPHGATLIENPLGTAPGFFMRTGKATYYFLPGVPRECRAMMEATVLPHLAATVHGQVFRSIIFRTFGMTESQLDQTLKEAKLPAGVRLGYRAVFPEIHVKLFAAADDPAKADQLLAAAGHSVRARVGEVIYSDDGRSLEQVVLDLCRERGLRLAVAESCTGGLIAKRLTDIPGSSDVFEAGFVTYSNAAKTELLNVPPDTIAASGAVSRETALAMAAGALARSRADLALAVTGIAGPAGGTPDKPVGTVFMAVADHAGARANRYLFARWERTLVRELTAQAGLEIIRRTLLGLPGLERK